MAEIDEKILKQIFHEYRGESGFVIKTWEEFRDLVKKAYPLLIDAARKETLITYGEVGGKIGLYVGSDLFVPKIGYVVGACSYYEDINGHPLISAIVVNETTMQPGQGFFGLSRIPSHLRKKTRGRAVEPDDFMTSDRVAFWAQEVKRVFEWWRARDC